MMKRFPVFSRPGSAVAAAFLSAGFLFSQDAAPPEALVVADDPATLAEQSEKLAIDQDELSADVMELVEEQTVPQVIKLLEEVESIMSEVTDDLIDTNTGGPTIAAQTEIIEKIFEAAKQRQQSSQSQGDSESQESMGAMLDMMQRMMGQDPGSQNQGEKPGEDGEVSGNGQGQTGDSDKANEASDGKSTGESETRTIPKGSGPAGRELPGEFRKFLDAYNRNSP